MLLLLLSLLLACCFLHVSADAPFGVALLFDSWSWGDGALGVPGWPHVLPADIPTEPNLQTAADAVRAQADAVRALKTRQGLGNKVGRARGREGCRLLGVGCVTGVGWLQGRVCTGFLTKARKQAETCGAVKTNLLPYPSFLRLRLWFTEHVVCGSTTTACLLCPQDPAVVAAVAQLQALKEQLSRLEGLQQAFAHGRQSQLQPLLQALQEQQQPSPPQLSR